MDRKFVLFKQLKKNTKHLKMCFSYHSSILVTLLSTLTYYGLKEMVQGTSALLDYLWKSSFPIFFLASSNSLFLILNKFLYLRKS